MFRNLVAALIILMLCVPLSAFDMSAGAEETVELSICLPDYSPTLVGGKPRMISGVFNVVNISADTIPDHVSVIMYPGETIPEVKNETNYYRWNYTDGVFECIYGDYIDESMSSTDEHSIKFAVGTSILSTPGGWTLKAESDSWERTYQVVTEIPMAPISYSSPDFYFTTSPFSGEEFRSSDDRMYFRTMNTGNIPVKLDITYDKMSQYISTTNATGIIDIGEERYHHISFATPIWGPRRVRINVRIRAEPYILPVTPATVQLMEIFEFPVYVTIEIVRPGFKLAEVGDVIVQYRETASVAFQNITELEMYLTGETEMSVLSSVDKLALESTIYDGRERGETVSVPLTNATEQLITYTVKGVEPNTVGQLRYMLSWDDNQEIIVTEVTTGPAPEGYTEEENGFNTAGLIFILIIIAVTVAIIFLIVKKRPKETERERKRREWLERHKGKMK
ncbi:MAG: hypothetical protein R6U17_07870 [Thermoplasmata archaeon]